MVSTFIHVSQANVSTKCSIKKLSTLLGEMRLNFISTCLDFQHIDLLDQTINQPLSQCIEVFIYLICIEIGLRNLSQLMSVRYHM